MEDGVHSSSTRSRLASCRDGFEVNDRQAGPYQGLRSVNNIVKPSYSRSSRDNMKRSERLLLEYAKKHGTQDPFSVTPHSSRLVLNLLVEKCRYDTKIAMKLDTMGGYAQVLRLVYSEQGHTEAWYCDKESGKAFGNPFINNPDYEKFRKAYRVNLARYGDVKTRSRPLTSEIVCDHAEQFWFGTKEWKLLDVIFHSVSVLGLFLGLRFDEISKLRMENVSVGRQSASLTLKTAIKNWTVERVYEVGDWHGNSALMFSVYMDPFVALHSWLIVRVNDAGFLFPSVLDTMGGCRLEFMKPLSCNKFVVFMRKRLMDLGIGSDDVNTFTGHSIKRGCVQLHRSLGYVDEFILRKLGMVGSNAYANYCAAYNNDAPQELPRFNSWQMMMRHAEAIAGEASWINDSEAFEEFEKEVFGDVDTQYEEQGLKH